MRDLSSPLLPNYCPMVPPLNNVLMITKFQHELIRQHSNKSINIYTHTCMCVCVYISPQILASFTTHRIHFPKFLFHVSSRNFLYSFCLSYTVSVFHCETINHSVLGKFFFFLSKDISFILYNFTYQKYVSLFSNTELFFLIFLVLIVCQTSIL